MKVMNFRISPDSKYRWVLFIFLVIAQFSVCGYIAWRWHNIQVDGIPYQWKCIPRLEQSAFGTDYIRVVFPEDTIKWLDDTEPRLHETIYVYISRDDKGVIQINGASAHKPPVGEDYMNASVVGYGDSIVQFLVGFDRYRIDPAKADGIYDIGVSDSVIASIRMKKGEGVIEGIFVNGMPLEFCGSEAEKTAESLAGKAAGKPAASVKTHILGSAMVPPKQQNVE